MKMRMVFVALAALFLVFSSGCTIKMYDGPSLARGERAILSGDCPTGWEIDEINGREAPHGGIYPFPQFLKYEIPPGDTIVVLRCPWNGFGHEIVMFHAKPGRTYAVGRGGRDDSFSIGTDGE